MASCPPLLLLLALLPLLLLLLALLLLAQLELAVRLGLGAHCRRRVGHGHLLPALVAVFRHQGLQCSRCARRGPASASAGVDVHLLHLHSAVVTALVLAVAAVVATPPLAR